MGFVMHYRTVCYGKIDQIVYINLAYKVLLMLFTSHCDYYRSVDVGTLKMTLDGLIMQKDHVSFDITIGHFRERINKFWARKISVKIKLKLYPV